MKRLGKLLLKALIIVGIIYIAVVIFALIAYVVGVFGQKQSQVVKTIEYENIAGMVEFVEEMKKIDPSYEVIEIADDRREPPGSLFINIGCGTTDKEDTYQLLVSTIYYLTSQNFIDAYIVAADGIASDYSFFISLQGINTFVSISQEYLGESWFESEKIDFIDKSFNGGRLNIIIKDATTEKNLYDENFNVYIYEDKMINRSTDTPIDLESLLNR